MTQEDKELLLKDICARIPYGVKLLHILSGEITTLEIIGKDFVDGDIHDLLENFKPYLRPMTSMTLEEAKEISNLYLYGLEDILSIKIKDEYIEVIVDDGFCSTETRTIWYDEIISSIEIFDLLNAHHLDYRDLIGRGLAIEAKGKNNPYKV